MKKSFKLATASVGMGIIGDAFDSEGLKQGAETTDKFIPTMVNIEMGSMTIDMLKKLKKKHR